jgi:hypothetical protein
MMVADAAELDFTEISLSPFERNQMLGFGGWPRRNGSKKADKHVQRLAGFRSVSRRMKILDENGVRGRANPV